MGDIGCTRLMVGQPGGMQVWDGDTLDLCLNRVAQCSGDQLLLILSETGIDMQQLIHGGRWPVAKPLNDWCG